MDALFEIFNSIYPMSNGLRNYLAKHLKSRKLKKREFLVLKGQTNSIGSFLNYGLLHCYYPENDRKITSWFLQEKKLAVSVQSFFLQVPSNEVIEALEPCELLYLTVEELGFAYSTYMELNYIIRELLQTYYLIKEEHAYQLQKSATARERFDWFQKRFPDVITRVAMRHIASFLGVTEETLSRIRSPKP